MKCYRCNGSGVDDDRLICYRCGGSGVIEMTNEEWLRSATFEEMAGAIYEWHTNGYARGRLEVDLNPITEVVEWLKQPYREG